MATTIQTTPAQRQASQASALTTTKATNKANPQLKRIVYSKYREMLGSYNDKANAIIDSLPAFMVKEDRGFHFDPQIIDEVDKVVYGTPPAPPISGGTIPSQRPNTQMPQHNIGEAPACVQNAMMTKDKKPFTYTPGGIDLSQIRSPRMAQRLARNAQSEGATGQQQLNRPQTQSNGGASSAAQLGATAMGMPFQVLPTGPPPPPPQPHKGSTGAPPPPPPAPQAKLAPQTNGNAARKSPTPQNFEPPPMGFRPEIKIPPNPMAALRKVPPPQEKNNFWVEEYRKERSKSPMVGNDENDYNRPPPTNNQQPETNQYTVPSQPCQQQQRSLSPQPLRQQPETYNQPEVSPPRTPVQEQPRRTETPNQAQYSPQPQQHQQQQLPAIQRQFSQNQPQNQAKPSPQNSAQSQPQQSPPAQRQEQFNRPTSPQYQQPQQQPQQQSPTQTVPWRNQRSVPQNAVQNNVSRPRDVSSPSPCESPRPQPKPQQHQQPQQQYQQPQQQYPAYLRSREVLSPGPEPQASQPAQSYQQKNAQVGSIYIPPIVPQQQQQLPQQQPLRQAPANRWGSTQPSAADTQTLNRLKSPPPPSSNGFSSTNNTGLKLQILNSTLDSTGKERIIPIQLEQTPTPTRMSSAPGFGPQPFYNASQQQYNSMPSPPLGQGISSNGQTPPGYVIRSPNQFVDQGYNKYPAGQDPNRVASPVKIIQQTNTAGGVKERVIPIAVDTQPDGPLNPNNVRGPISKQPLVIQNDPRNQNPNAWGSGNTTPNQSRSFRILQKITDTTEDTASDSKAIESDGGDPEPQLQRPTYARQMGPGQLNSPTIDQMKRMQVGNDRTRNPDEVDESAAAKAADVDPRYRGPSNPSKTFKKLQGAIERSSPSRNDRDGTPPVMKQPQPNRYVSQRPAFSPEEQSQQYVHPSEQQVPEPKKYTGSAIPSRSFKILQAMTTPENAAEMEGSDVVEQNKSITECPCQRSAPRPCSYPYPYLPPCCHRSSLPPGNSVGDDLCNWHNPPPYLPHHPHYPYYPHHHLHSHPHQHHPYPPCPCYYYYHRSNEYDSQNCSQCQTHDSFRRSKSMSQELPNIIITPSADDARASHSVRDPELDREKREGSVIETLSRMLNEIEKPSENVFSTDQASLDVKEKIEERPVNSTGLERPDKPISMATQSTKDECLPNTKVPIPEVKMAQTSAESTTSMLTSSTKDAFVTDIKISDNLGNRISSEDKTTDRARDTIPLTKSTNKVSIKSKIPEKSVGKIESDDSSSDDLLTSSSDQSSTSTYEECAERIPNNGLQSIKSVTNIQVYQKKIQSAMDTYDEDHTAADGESMIFDNEEEGEAEYEAEELEYDEEGLIEEMASEEEEEGIRELEEDEEDEVIIMDNLSVIYEENETDAMSPRPSSRVSSSVSDSTTLANEECEYDEHNEKLKGVEEYDENSNSVTVRLPLKFSFSRSSNDENIATVEVGSSQIQEQRRTFSVASIKADSVDDEESDLDDCDVSITVSLSPSSDSIDRKSSLSLAPQKIYPNASERNNYNLDAENMSGSLSLPMRNKFLNQTWTGDLTNNIAMEDAAAPDEPTSKQIVNTDRADVWSSSSEVAKVIEETRRRNSRVLEDKDENITDSGEIKKNKIVEHIEKLSKSILRKESKENAGDDLDFWATLQATRKEAQLLLEKTSDYWGKKANEKKEAEPTVAPESQLESDEDFWANIRVKDAMISSEPNLTTTQEKQEIAEDETQGKTVKPKKKKKIIKMAEKKPEPKHELTIINLPNANNRARIVESTIKMIQQKVQKPKDYVKKEIKKEIEVSDFVASIKDTYDKEPKAAKPVLSRKLSRSMGSEDAPEKDDKVIEVKKEQIKVKPRKEIIQFLTQVFELKYAKSSAPTQKLVPLQATLGEIVQERSDNVIEENVKEALEPEKKLAKSAKNTEEAEKGTLKPLKTKAIKKTTRDSKKKKEDDGKPKPIVVNEEIQREEGPESVIVEIIDESQTHVKEVEVINEYEASPDVGQEIDFWATIQPSESESCFETDASIYEKEDDQECDFWAEISSAEENANQRRTCTQVTIEDDLSSVKQSNEDSQEVDFWAEISAINSMKEEDNVEVDFWAEIEAAKIQSSVKVQQSQADHQKIEEPIVVVTPTNSVQSEETVAIEQKTTEPVELTKSNSNSITIKKEVDAHWSDISKIDGISTENDPQPEPQEKKSILNDNPIDFWAQIEASKTEVLKKTSKLSTLHIYNDADVELVNLTPAPIFYASYTQVELHSGFWASVGYFEKEKEPDIWSSNNADNETEANSELETGKIDFWVTQRKFETDSRFDREATPKQEEVEEVDFWAQIKGPEDEEELSPVVTKDVCEVRRNNYRKAMAFFTNTVSIEKNDDSTTLSEKNQETKPLNMEIKRDNTPNISTEGDPHQTWDWQKEDNKNQTNPPEDKPYKPWGWKNSLEHEWKAPDERQVNDVFLVVEDHENEDETDTLVENNPYKPESVSKDHEEAVEEAPSESSESINEDITPNHFEVQHQYPKPELAPIKPKEQSVEPAVVNKFRDEIKISVKDRIFAFEAGKIESPTTKNPSKTSLNVDSATPKSNLSRNSSQRSESEIEEDDSGVTDMKLLSETDTESESFPELRKMSHYQRASTHSRLFQLLQDEGDIIEEEKRDETKEPEEELNFKQRKKIVHNVSVTRKQNPNSMRDAETMTQRRERLSLPLRKNTSIDADNPSSPNSPASPIFGQPTQDVSDKLVNELVQSLLLKKSSSTIRNLPMEKLQAAAKRALEEELDSLENTSLDSTPALTPQEFKSESYSDYYDSWSAKNSSNSPLNSSSEILPSKAFKNLQDSTVSAKRRPLSVRCPRVLSSKTVNRDLARVTESPEICSRKSRSPDIAFGSDRACSVGRWRKV